MRSFAALSILLWASGRQANQRVLEAAEPPTRSRTANIEIGMFASGSICFSPSLHRYLSFVPKCELVVHENVSSP